jgi:hypothetical protein
MTIACYLDRSKADRWMRAFAVGCRGRVIAGGRRDLRADDHCVMGNWPVATKLIAEFKQSETSFWYLDTGYIQTPERSDLRVERNRFWPDLTLGEHTMERALAMGVQLAPWRTDGRHVLICQHGYKFGRPWGINIAKWHRDIEARVRAATDRPIVVRPKLAVLTTPLEKDLKDAWCLVTHSSTAAVKAVLAGVPVFCEPTCAAAMVGCTDFSQIENPLRPEREEWIAELACRQFSQHEMQSGMAWACVRGEQ